MGACMSAWQAPEVVRGSLAPEDAEVVFARAKLEKTCIHALLVDASEPCIFYAGAWDGSVRRYSLAADGSGKLTRVYDGCSAAVEGLAQCVVAGDVDLLFAVPSGQPGVCCWRKKSGELAAIFTVGAGGFAGTAIHASPTILFCGHTSAGVVCWELDAHALATEHGAHMRDAAVLELGGSFETARGVLTVLSSTHVSSMAAWPAPGMAGRTRRLVTGHETALAQMATTSNALVAASLLSMPTYAALVWDAIGGHVLGVLPYKHRAPIRAVTFSGDDNVISADMHGLAVEWSVADAAPLRMFASEQGPCRALIVLLDQPWPLGSGGGHADLLLTGSDRGPPIVAHKLAGDAHESAASTAVVPVHPPPSARHGARPAPPQLPPGALSSLYCLAACSGSHAAASSRQSGRASGSGPGGGAAGRQHIYISGHLSGEIFVWSDTALLGRIAPLSSRFVGVRQTLDVDRRTDGPLSPRVASAALLVPGAILGACEGANVAASSRSSSAGGCSGCEKLIAASSQTSDVRRPRRSNHSVDQFLFGAEAQRPPPRTARTSSSGAQGAADNFTLAVPDRASGNGSAGGASLFYA